MINSLKTQARCFLLRSDLEIEDSLELLGNPDLVIIVDPNYSESGSGVVSVIATSTVSALGNPESLTINCSLNTAPHAIRDLILDRFKELF